MGGTYLKTQSYSANQITVMDSIANQSAILPRPLPANQRQSGAGPRLRSVVFRVPETPWRR